MTETFPLIYDSYSLNFHGFHDSVYGNAIKLAERPQEQKVLPYIVEFTVTPGKINPDMMHVDKPSTYVAKTIIFEDQSQKDAYADKQNINLLINVEE